MPTNDPENAYGLKQKYRLKTTFLTGPKKYFQRGANACMKYMKYNKIRKIYVIYMK